MMLLLFNITNSDEPAQPKPQQAARISWFYDWASSPLPTLHSTFVFAVYFTTVIAPENGSFYWAQMTALSAFLWRLQPHNGRYATVKGCQTRLIVSSVIAAAVQLLSAFIRFYSIGADFIRLICFL